MAKPTETDPARVPARIMVVTGTRAEFGLLTPVMRAVEAHPALQLQVVAAGSHLVPPALTFRDVKAVFDVVDSVPMQRPGHGTRLDDAEAVGRGMARFARTLAGHEPDWVVVLGDRIEAFAAASAASLAGVAVAHIHGGDRAEGIADEAMRHAITKLAHLHLPATEMSAARIRRMGERPDDVIVIGSPAIDGLSEIPPIDDDALEKYAGVRECPGALVLLHPAGRDDATEAAAARSVIDGVRHAGAGTVVALQPNHDAGRHAVLAELQAARDNGEVVAIVPNMPRALFVGLLKRMATHNGVLVGNSSAALIEAAAVPIAAVDVGPRQAGRERAGNVVHAADETAAAIAAAVQRAREMQLDGVHPYGDGVAGMRAAEAIAARDAQDAGMLRKRFVD